MSSGFSQSANQLRPNYYRVTLDMSSATYFPTTNTNTNGAVEPYDSNSFTTLPSSNTNALRRARGNIRWNNILMALGNEADCQILDVTPTTAAATNANTFSTALAFTIGLERDDFILQKYNGTTDLNSQTITTVAGALKHVIAGAILQATTRSYRTTSTTQGEMQESVTIAAPCTASNIYTGGGGGSSLLGVTRIEDMTIINGS